MTTRQAPPPRPSGQTTVGLGVLEGARERERIHTPLEREEAITPPSGTDAEQLRRADVSLLLREIHESEERSRARDEETAARVDGLITDLRGLLATQRSRDEALFSLLGIPEAMRKLEERQAITQAAVRALDTRVGYPPSTEDFARASAHDVTPEQLAKLEQDHKLGTGIWRFVMSLHLRTSSSTRVAVGVGGGGGAVLGAVLSELLRLAF